MKARKTTIALAIIAAALSYPIQAETPTALFESYLQDLPDCEIHFTKALDPSVSKTLEAMAAERPNGIEPNPFGRTFEEVSQVFSHEIVFRKQGSRFLIERNAGRISSALAFDGTTYYQRSAHRKELSLPWTSKLVIASDFTRLGGASGVLRDIPVLIPFLSILDLGEEQARLIESFRFSPWVSGIYNLSPFADIQIQPGVEIHPAENQKLIWGKHRFPTFFEQDNGERGTYQWAVLKSAPLSQSSDFFLPTEMQLKTYYGKERRLGVNSYRITIDQERTKLLTEPLPDEEFRIPESSAEVIMNYNRPRDQRKSVTPILEKTTWSNQGGGKMEAQVFRIRDSRVHFFTSGREVAYPISRLSEEDQEILKKAALGSDPK